MRAKFVNENTISFERNRDPKRSLGVGQVVANRDPNRRLHNFSMAFPELRFPYRSESALMAPGSHPKWQIINASIKDPKDNLSVEERAEKYLDWFKKYTDFDIVEIEHSSERSYHEWGDPNKPKHTDQMIAIKMRNKEDMTAESLDFERGLDPKTAMKVGVNKDNYFRTIESLPFKDMIEKHGDWPEGEARDILKVASEILGRPEEDVRVGVEYGDEYLTTSRIEGFMDDHEWTYGDEGHTDNFDLIESSTYEIYVVDMETRTPHFILGTLF